MYVYSIYANRMERVSINLSWFGSLDLRLWSVFFQSFKFDSLWSQSR